MSVILDPENDSFVANRILNGYPHQPGYSEIYSWTNEVLTKYYKYEDLTNKKALCVTASGDHSLHAILAGATYIDSFDVNKLAKYYARLKTAMINTYDFKTFLKQFKNGVYVKSNLDLDELSTYLTYEDKIFWQIVFSNPYYDYDSLYKTDGYYSSIEENCDYLNEDNYNELKRKLKNTEINYHDLNIKYYDSEKELTTYDAIFLSNIAEYTGNQILDCGNKLLNNNGILYNHHSTTNPRKIIVPGLDYENCITTIKNIDNTNLDCGVSIYRKR